MYDNVRYSGRTWFQQQNKWTDNKHYINPFKSVFTNVIFIHYKPGIAVAIILEF